MSCFAQTTGFKYFSNLDSIKKSGFYNISISPEISSHLKTDYSDVRITNESGKWIPHLLYAPVAEDSNSVLLSDLKYNIAENTTTATEIIIDANQPTSNNIGLRLTNSTAERYGSFSGSNDKINWFSINDSIVLKPIADEKETATVIRINFPTNNFRYFKMVIHNNHKNPFEIKGVIEFVYSAGIGNPAIKLITNPAPLIQQMDSGKISYIRVSQQQPFHFDHISFQTWNVKYFNRRVDIYVPTSKNHSYANPGQWIQSFTISNNSNLQCKVPLTKASVFYVLIYNEDNLPLFVKELSTACSHRYITAFLEFGIRYKLMMDYEQATIPHYDLSFLNTKLPDSIPFLNSSKIVQVISKQANNINSNNKWILWISIAAALVILLFFTFKMIKEVDKNKQA